MLNIVLRYREDTQEIIKIVFSFPGIHIIIIVKNHVFLKGNLQDAQTFSFFELETSSFGIRWFKGLLIW